MAHHFGNILPFVVLRPLEAARDQEQLLGLEVQFRGREGGAKSL